MKSSTEAIEASRFTKGDSEASRITIGDSEASGFIGGDSEDSSSVVPFDLGFIC